MARVVQMKPVHQLGDGFAIQGILDGDFQRHFIVPPQPVIGGKPVAFAALQTVQLVRQGRQRIAAVNHDARGIFVQVRLGGFVDDRLHGP
ncbi:hypothetical protein D3C75_568370 [compost metagenome]